MMNAAKRPDEFIADIVAQFAPAAQLLPHSSVELTVTDHLTSARISFSREEIDDLAEALKRPKGTAYFANLGACPSNARRLTGQPARDVVSLPHG